MIDRMSLNELYGKYLCASYLYYIKMEDTPWSDHEFDMACNRLRDEWEFVTHRLKGLCDIELLQAGSGYAIPEARYPEGLIHAALAWQRGEVGC